MKFCNWMKAGALLAAFTLPAAAQPPAAAPTPDSIEKMFAEELDTVRGRKEPPKSDVAHKALIDALLERLSDPDPNRKFEASLLLENEVLKTDVPRLAVALTENRENFDSELVIIRALGATKDPSAAEVLRSAFNSGNPVEQIVVVDALAQIPDDIVVNMLADTLGTGDNSAVHVRAASALGKIGGPRAIYALNATHDSLKTAAEKAASAWALRVATKDVTPDRTDSDLEEGRQQNYYYKGMMYYVFRPAFRKDAPKDSWLIVCAHGFDLDYEAVIDLCQPLAKAQKATLLVPFFDPIAFPDYDRFNLHGIRSDKRLLELVDMLAVRAGVKTREFYLLGFGGGGDFAERFTYFYPDRIARSAFTPSFFYPMLSDRYFPDGLRPNPLAPDLKVDLLKVVKSDFMIILNPYQAHLPEWRFFQTSLAEYSKTNQRISRIRWKQMSEKGNNLGEAFEIGRAFLFPKDESGILPAGTR